MYAKRLSIFRRTSTCLRTVTGRWHRESRDASDRIRQPLSPISCFQRRSLYGSEPFRITAAISLRHVGIRWVRINTVASDRRERSRRPIDGVLAPRDQSDAVRAVSGFERCRSGSRFEERPKRVIGESIPVVRVCNRAGLLDLVQMLVECGLGERLCLSLRNHLWTPEQRPKMSFFVPISTFSSAERSRSRSSASSDASYAVVNWTPSVRSARWTRSPTTSDTQR
jgi:hypothetical protein